MGEDVEDAEDGDDVEDAEDGCDGGVFLAACPCLLLRRPSITRVIRLASVARLPSSWGDSDQQEYHDGYGHGHDDEDGDEDDEDDDDFCDNDFDDLYDYADLLRGCLQPRSRLGLEGVEGDPDTSPGQEFPRRHSGSFHPLLLLLLLLPVYSQLLKFAP